jgi:hypothetical protein
MSESGLRIARAPIPKLIGSSAICLSGSAVETSASSDLSSDDSAVTDSSPTVIVTSTRVITASCTSTFAISERLTACSTVRWQAPTGT